MFEKSKWDSTQSGLTDCPVKITTQARVVNSWNESQRENSRRNYAINERYKIKEVTLGMPG